MSLRWTPLWKVEKIEYRGKDLEVCKDEHTGLYACPYCTPACKKGEPVIDGAFFYTLEDLKRHLDAHKTSYWVKGKRTVEEEEEEEYVTGEEEEDET
ncbi:MAG: hypothetical protein OWQ54_07190 [Sulfolobaceae archaeon]|nr:hypothetical protein [Sulfolobaceae archaeon]